MRLVGHPARSSTSLHQHDLPGGSGTDLATDLARERLPLDLLDLLDLDERNGDTRREVKDVKGGAS